MKFKELAICDMLANFSRVSSLVISSMLGWGFWSFAIGEIIKEERRLANMTQDELADKTGTKKSFISRIENGHSDIQLSTLFKLIELGLGRKISLTIE